MRVAALRQALVLLVLGLGLIFLTPAQGRAESWFEHLVMPGELAEAHAKLQTNCQNCHKSFSQGSQPELCLACHKNVAADVAAQTGFHGHSPEATALACASCHSDHQGRDFNLVRLDPETFDHTRTDFPLTDAHARVPCASCHAAGKKFAAVSSACADCHKEADPHKGALGPDCGACHTGSRWTEIKGFDHGKTKFALNGQHARLNCDACHVAQTWKGLPVDCAGCHQIDDVHKARFPDCATCHAVEKWSQVRFDHDRDTKFALKGKHRKVECETCHQPGTEPAKAPQDCAGCHQKDDVHKASLGPDCAACHTVEGWDQGVVFDHDLTRMPLLGQHAVVPCDGCHVTKVFNEADPACVTCHADKDVHKAALGSGCGDCHTPNGWAFWRFDHGASTDFPLTGAHQGLVCAACHLPGSEPAKVAVACVSCHQKADVHKGGFGTRCETCHDTTSFKGAHLKMPQTP